MGVLKNVGWALPTLTPWWRSSSRVASHSAQTPALLATYGPLSGEWTKAAIGDTASG